MSTPEKPEYWSAIYREEPIPRWDIGAPAPPLKRIFESGGLRLAPPAKLLVPGCGFGNDVAFLAGLAYQTTGLDFCEDAIIGARSRVTNPHAQFLQADLFTLPSDPAHVGHYDAVVEHTCFVAIPRERRRDYAATAHAVLRDGGFLIGLFYNHGREGGPPHDATAEDILEVFSPYFRIVSLERPLDSHDKRSFREWLAVMEKA